LFLRKSRLSALRRNRFNSLHSHRQQLTSIFRDHHIIFQARAFQARAFQARAKLALNITFLKVNFKNVIFVLAREREFRILKWQQQLMKYAEGTKLYFGL
jgi:hypothetical protein